MLRPFGVYKQNACRFIYKCLAVIAVLALLGTIFLSGCEKQRHESGRDTIASFGDGTYQILGPSFEKILMDVDNQEDLLINIVDFRNRGDYVYAFGQMEYSDPQLYYLILNYRTGEHKYYKQIDQAPAQSRSQLSRLRTRALY